jgi:hypothetical protein
MYVRFSAFIPAGEGGRIQRIEEKTMVSTGEVLEYLRGIDLPKSKSELVQYAQSKNAPKDVIDLLNKIPDQQFGNTADITHAIGQVE